MQYLRCPFDLTLVFACVCFVIPAVCALEPVTLEPSNALDVGTLELSEQAIYEQFDDDRVVLNTELEYAFSDRLGLRLAIPAYLDDENDGMGDLRLRLQLVLNPDATRWPIATLSAEAFAPTGEHSDSLGGELRLRLTKPLGERHALHFDLAGGHPTDDGEDIRDLYYRVVAGYSYEASESTTLFADLVRRQLEAEGENSNLLEVGVHQRLNDTAALTLGVGAGLGEESPDWTLNAGLELRFQVGK